MILVVAAVACVLSVPLSGGKLRQLAELRVRWPWAAFAALGVQVVITTLAPAGSPTLHAVLHVASYALAGACIVANRRTLGVPILAVGAGLNSLAILANHGVMPASATAMRIAGIPAAAHFANSAPMAHPHLLLIGDVIPVPGPWPLGNVMSAGDILILLGLMVVLHHTCRATRAEPTGHGVNAVLDTPAT